ncbi:MAG: hypothetical protein ACRD8Z_27930 [Nitrososphaeraceae archaeon]
MKKSTTSSTRRATGDRIELKVMSDEKGLDALSVSPGRHPNPSESLVVGFFDMCRIVFVLGSMHDVRLKHY